MIVGAVFHSLDHCFRFVGGFGVILLSFVERIAGHGHVDGGQGGFYCLLRHIHVTTEHVAGLALVGGGEIERFGLGQIVDNEGIHAFDVCQFRFSPVRRAVEADRQRTEDAYEIEIGIGAPEIGLPERDVALFLRGLRALGIFDHVIGQLDDLKMLIPRGYHPFVVGRGAESIQLSASLLVRSGIGRDVVALPLGILHVGVRLRLRDLREQGVNSHVEFVLGGVERLGSEASFGFFVEEIGASRGAEQRGGEECSEKNMAFHDGDRN